MIVNINLLKFLFASLTICMVIFGTLINLWEKYLPVFITRSFRYGKFASKNDSFLVKNMEVPKSYFRHFYFTAALIYYPIALYEVLSVYVFDREVSTYFKNLLDFSCGNKRVATVSTTHVLIAVLLMVLQAFRRFYDTHFVSVFSKNAMMNLSHYFIGMIHYPAVMLVILSEAPKFASSVDSKLQIQDVGLIEVGAIVLFLWAWYHQHQATVILADLRKNEKGDVVNQEYKIPQGDWFNYLSSPHSTAEIIMYSALTILLANNTGWWYVYVWVVSNQVETILLSHWWYQKTFKTFPKKRKALIPFVI